MYPSNYLFKSKYIFYSLIIYLKQRRQKFIWNKISFLLTIMVINMKKIFAIVISLLFVVSVFGVAQTMAIIDRPPLEEKLPEYCSTEYYKISSNAPKVGQTFTISLYTDTYTFEDDDPIFKILIDGKRISGLESIDAGIIGNGGLPYRIGPVELINADYYDEDWDLIHSGLVLKDCGQGFPCWSELPPDPNWDDVRWITWTFRAVTPGKLTLNGACGETETVTILSKDLPFKFFAKLFGFGKKD